MKHRTLSALAEENTALYGFFLSYTMLEMIINLAYLFESK